MEESMNRRIADRSSNMELLRILTMCGVIVLHYNNGDIGGGLSSVPKGSLNAYLLMLLESVFVCAVNVFILLTGYYSGQRYRISLMKPCQLLAEVMILSGAVYLAKILTGGGWNGISISGVLSAFVPRNWFVFLYVALYVISPYLNVLLAELSDMLLQKMLLILLLIFSAWPTLVNFAGEAAGVELQGLSTVGMYGDQEGYTIVNFVLLYIIGAALRRGIVRRCRTCRLFLALGVCVGILTAWAQLAPVSALSYSNPVVIVEAALVLLLFERMPPGRSKTVNVLAAGSFTVFLTHNYLVTRLSVEKMVTGNMFMLLCHVILSAVLIYLLCWCVYFAYDRTAGSVWRFLLKRVRFPVIAAKEEY